MMRVEKRGRRARELEGKDSRDTGPCAVFAFFRRFYIPLVIEAQFHF
jgi:hypothetical protein